MPGQNPDNQGSSIFGLPGRAAELIVRYHDGGLGDVGLGDAEVAELRAALERDTRVRDLFVYMGLQAQALNESLSAAYGEPDTPDTPQDVASLRVVPSSEQDYQQMLDQLARMEASAEAEVIRVGGEGHAADRCDVEDAGALPAHEIASVGGYLLRQALTSKPALLGMAAAVALLCVIVLGPWGSDDAANDGARQVAAVEPQPIAPIDSASVATLTATHNAQWGGSDSSAPVQSDALVAGDTLTLTEGFAQITTLSGAVVILEAPATVEVLDNDNALRLHAGKLIGLCHTDASKGFVVKTDYADITDLGTEFGVHAHDTGVETTVFIGEVEIETPAGLPERVMANQTATLAVSRNNRELIVEDQLAAGFEPLRDQQVVFAAKLRGTGEGIASYEKDPSWRITAVNGQPFDEPIALQASTLTEPFTSDNPDPLAPTQKLQHTFNDGSSNSVCRIETTLRLPESFDPDRMQLALRFRADNELMSLKVNGQGMTVPEQHPETFNRVYTMVIDRPLRRGDNHFVFEVRNDGVSSDANVVGLQVARELAPRTTNPSE